MPKLKNTIIVVISILLTSTIVTVVVLHHHSRFLLTVFPPDDLYEPLINIPVKLSDTGATYDFDLTIKYVGTYLIRFSVEHGPDSIFQSIETEAVLRLNAICGGVQIDMTLDNWGSRFSELGKNRIEGAIIGFFKTPDDLGFGKCKHARISIENGDPEFSNKYGNSKIVIKRASDL